ncbi:MAG: twin-arginine translocase subunit TatC [Planctomycetales bacterium]|nr:twin-arginine translocase subunit TatC [Planctomycetales bacterium]
MATMHNEDLFETTKMSFGEHLEELRVCLVKSLIGLAIGFLVGLFVAGPVVEKIEGPLQRGLANYYFNKTKRELEGQYGPLQDDLETFMRKENFVYQEVYWEVNEVTRILNSDANALQAEAIQQRENGVGSAVTASENAASESGTDTPVDTDGKRVPELNAFEQTFVVGGAPGAPSTHMIKTRLWRPMDANVTSLSAHEPFMIYIKAAVITGALLASPWIFFQIWSFIAAGLYPHEKNYVHLFLPISLGLFLAGSALAFFFVFDPVLEFLFHFNELMNIDPDPRISEWMSFVLLMPLGFGISFQLPLVMMLLERIGVVSISAYLDKWRIAVLGIFVLSMILTPADPISMLLMAIPLTLLYFGGILLCKYMPRRASPYGEGFDPS